MWFSRSLPLALISLTAFADQRGDTPGTAPSTPQEQLAKFHVPPGFEVQLVAAEPEIQKPINLNFDAAGRLWVSGSEMYPWPASTDVNGAPIADFGQGWRGIVEGFRVGDAPQPSAEARDTVRVLSDFDATGHARKIRIFADKLNIPSGIQPLPRRPLPSSFSSSSSRKAVRAAGRKEKDDDEEKDEDRGSDPKGDTAIVYSIPNIWLMTDVDGDGFAEKREPLYTGFGYTDTHGGSSSYIHWIDGWIYGTHGFRNHSEVRDRNGRVTVLDSGNTYRFRPDGTAFEIYAHGQTNPFGLAFDPLGNLFSADSHSKPVMMLLRGGYYQGIGKQHDGLGFAPTITDDDHGSSAIAGIAYYADDKWPGEYRGNLFNGNPATRRINRDRLEWHGSTPRAIRMPDFLTCDDPWFRPVNLKLGPDGALYIADFYNPIIGHYEVPLTHPARDHTHGRIWRVVWRGEKASAPLTGHDAGKGNAAAPGSAGLRPVGDGILPSRTSPGSVVVADRSSPEVRRDGTSRPTSQRLALPGPPDLTQLDAPALIEKLADPSLEVRRLATNELVDRVDREMRTAAVTKWAYEPRPDFNLDRATAGAAKLENQATHLNWISTRLARVERDNIDISVQISPLLEGSFLSESLACIVHELKSEMEIHAGDETAGWVAFIGTDRLFSDGSPRALQNCAALVSVGAIDFLVRSEGFGDLQKLKAAAAGNIAKSLKPLLTCWNYAPREDTMLIYSVRMALRDCLLVPGAYAKANEYAAVNSQAAEHLADVSLGAPTADSAAFLLAHLERTKLETPRAGEYLKHAVLYLPAEMLGAVAKLFSEGRAPSELPLPRRLALATNLAEALRQRGGAIQQELTTWSRAVILEALASDAADLSKPAIAAARDLTTDAKLAPLTKIIRDETRDGALCLAALEAVANLPASLDLLTTTLADPRHMNLRKRAAELLAQRGPDLQSGADPARQALLAALPAAPSELAIVIAGALAKSDAGCAALLDLIEHGKASATLLRAKLVSGALATRERGLQTRATALARALPPEDARLDQVIAERTDAFRKAKANSTHGAQVFQQQCAVCHRFRNTGGNVGPNLDGVVARGPQRLIEDILDPSRNVDPGFRQTIVETTDGQTLVGNNLREQGDVLTLTDATGKELTAPKSAIKSRTTLNLSLMPPAFETTIPPGDFSDLLAFLLSGSK